MNRQKGPGEIQCLKNVAAHHQTSLEDQAAEIQCIEQNLKSFHDLPDYNSLYEAFTQDFQFDISSIKQSEFNRQFRYFRAPINNDEKSKSILGKRPHLETLSEECQQFNNSTSVDYNWEVDFILKNAQQYNKEDKK